MVLIIGGHVAPLVACSTTIDQAPALVYHRNFGTLLSMQKTAQDADSAAQRPPALEWKKAMLRPERRLCVLISGGGLFQHSAHNRISLCQSSSCSTQTLSAGCLW